MGSVSSPDMLSFRWKFVKMVVPLLFSMLSLTVSSVLHLIKLNNDEQRLMPNISLGSTMKEGESIAKKWPTEENYFVEIVAQQQTPSLNSTVTHIKGEMQSLSNMLDRSKMALLYPGDVEDGQKDDDLYDFFYETEFNGDYNLNQDDRLEDEDEEDYYGGRFFDPDLQSREEGTGRYLALLQEKTFNKAVTDDLKMINPMDLVELANMYPSTIENLNAEQLEVALNNNLIISNLNDKAINYLVLSEPIAKKLERLPSKTIAAMITSNPKIAASFPSYNNFPTRALTLRLLHDREFLRMIPTSVHAHLAETPFRRLISPDIISLLLQVHPNLPLYLGKEGQKWIPKLIKRPLFINSLPCNVIIISASSKNFVERLSGEELSYLARNKKVWKCLPVNVVRNLLKNPDLGSRVGFGDLFQAARLMSTNTSLDSGVIWNLMRYQLPVLAAKSFNIQHV